MKYFFGGGELCELHETQHYRFHNPVANENLKDGYVYPQPVFDISTLTFGEQF
jgi:hypothetical protein